MMTALILGAAVHPDGPSPALTRRARQGARLFHAGAVSRLVACGGLGRHPPTEAEAIAEILLAEHVPDEAIGLETRSTTTAENIQNALPLLDGPMVVIVSDWFHLPRARLIARRAGLRVRTSAPSLRGARPIPQAKGALREIPACLACLVHLKG